MNREGYLCDQKTPLVSSHILLDRRSLAYHALIAERLSKLANPLLRTRENIVRWRALVPPGRAEPYYLRVWEDILDKGLEATIAFMTEDTEYACELRQSSPFAGYIDQPERFDWLKKWKENNSSI